MLRPCRGIPFAAPYLCPNDHVPLPPEGRLGNPNADRAHITTTAKTNTEHIAAMVKPDPK